MSHRNRCLLLALLATACLTGGCEMLQPTPIQAVYDAYHVDDYGRSLNLASRIVSSGPGVAGQRTVEEAAYMAGISAYQLGRAPTAVRYFSIAAQSRDRLLAADAQSHLGLIYAQQGRHDRAATQLLAAATTLTGQARAEAYFQAGLSQQKLGRWAHARTSLSLARSHSNDPTFRAMCPDQLSVSSCPLHPGAYHNPDLAENHARQLLADTAELNVGHPWIAYDVSSDNRQLAFVLMGNYSSYDIALDARQRIGSTSAIIVPLSGWQ